MITKVKLVNALARAGIVNIEVCGRGQNWEAECADRRAIVLFRRFCRQNKIAYHGYYTGYGALVARAGQGPQGYQYDCDFGDRASIHHY